jgi:RHS repeat-associated protein
MGLTGGHAVAQKRADFTYNAAGQLECITRYADWLGTQHVASSHYAYDGIGRLKSLIHSTNPLPPGEGWGEGPLAGYQYAYDTASRITSIDSFLDGLTTYTHDDTDQLKSADHTGQTDESYSYDGNGNRTMTGYAVQTNNRLASDGTYNYAYDDEGNRQTKTKISTGEKEEYTWDHRNRLAKITFKNSGGTVTKTVDQSYDAFNQWIKRSVDPDGDTGSAPVQNTFFSYEGGQVNLQFDGSQHSDLTNRYLWAPGVDQLLADETVTSLTTPGNVQWPLADHLGTLRDIADRNVSAGVTTVTNHRRYDSYGNLQSESNAAVDLLFGFTGRAFDEATGLQNNLNRWLDPKTGNWLSQDPIGFEGEDANLYRYVGNSPIDSIDPTGLVVAGDSVLGTAGLGALAGAMTVGKYLTYPLRWCGRDYSEQDAALEELWEAILNTNDTTTRPVTEGAAITASACTYGAIGAQGAANASILWKLAELRRREAILQQTIRELNALGFSARHQAAALSRVEREILRLESMLP